jgi:ER membrane protein complex subunit 6
MGPQGVAGSGNPEEDAMKISMEALQRNMGQIDIARTFLCIMGGVVAGILRCTGASGLICFIAIYVAITGVLALKIQFDFKQFTNMTLTYFLFSDLQKNALSFILFWTLTYALVYIY